MFCKTGLILSSTLEDKIIGGLAYTSTLPTLPDLASLRTGNSIYHYCVGYVLTHFTILSAARCIKPYENQPFFGGAYTVIGTRRHEILTMESHPKYNYTGIEEFDIGLITVSKFKNFEGYHKN